MPRPSPTPQQAQPRAFLTDTGFDHHNSLSLPNQHWYPDSGATHHVTNNSEFLLDGVNLPGSDQVLLGNGQGLSITSIGHTLLHSRHKNHTQFTLNSLLLVPDITKNLISASKFTKDNDVFFEFHADKCLVKSQAQSKVLLQGCLGKDGLYTFGDLQPLHGSSTSYVNTTTCSQASQQNNVGSSLYNV